MQVAQFKMNIPADLKKAVAESAAANERSQSGEIIYQLRRAYEDEEDQKK